jgi:hypothetical protein
MMLAALFVAVWLQQRLDAHPDLVPGYRVPPLLQVVALAGAVGFIVGLLVPRWGRDAPRLPTPNRSAGSALTATSSGVPDAP